MRFSVKHIQGKNTSTFILFYFTFLPHPFISYRLAYFLG